MILAVILLSPLFAAERAERGNDVEISREVMATQPVDTIIPV